MYPVAGGTLRMPNKDVVIGGKHVIPKNVAVFLPVSPAVYGILALNHKFQLPACPVWPVQLCGLTRPFRCGKYTSPATTGTLANIWQSGHLTYPPHPSYPLVCKADDPINY